MLTEVRNESATYSFQVFQILVLSTSDSSCCVIAGGHCHGSDPSAENYSVSCGFSVLFEKFPATITELKSTWNRDGKLPTPTLVRLECNVMFHLFALLAGRE